MIISNPEPCNNQTVDELAQTLPSFDPTCYSEDGSSFTYDSTPNFVDDSPNVFNPPSQPPTYSCEFCGNDAHYGYDCPPQVSFIYNLEPCYNQDFNFPQNFQELLQQEQAAFVSTLQQFNFIYDDDDDEESSIPLSDVISELPLCIAITPVLSTVEPVDSLIMKDEHLDTILSTESDELIKYSVENLVLIPSESKDFFDIECECDVPNCDDSQTTKFSTFSNPLFDNSTSSDDESSHEEVIQEISFKTYLNPLFDLDEKIISSEFNPIHNEDLNSTLKNDRFDIESYLIESLLNHDTLMASSPKIDSLLDEFAGELITNPPRIVNRENEEYISLLERLLYDDSIPPGIESDDYDSEGDDNSTSLPEFESFHVDYPDSGDSTIDVMDFDFIPSHNDLGSDLDVSSPSGDRNKIYDPGICIEVESMRFLATLSPVIDTLLPFSSKNEDKVFNHGVLASKEKSPPSSSHRGFKASKLFHHKIPMLTHGDNTPNLGVRHPHFYPP
ncbi:hypothetical protein Tco_0748200 [Tanacetum coccineum]|uniref:CCHC-type domain-containing protein n=1 Tax=Tanacetum coccineum TaxID=301880 RepID=A0ABQ4YV19_9ASTR